MLNYDIIIMKPHERAARLFELAAIQGLESPTETMIADAIGDAEADTLSDPVRVATENHGLADGGEFVQVMRRAVGTLAENAASDLDHFGKSHKDWYQAVKKARKLVELP